MLKKIFFGWLFIVFSSVALAAPTRNYNVEILIFSHFTPETLQSQSWTPVTTHDLGGAPQKITPALELQHEKNVLQRNSQYQVLFDGSFKEAWSGNQSSIAIPIASETAYGKLSGLMTITLSQYFDVHTNIFLTTSTNLLKQIDPTGYFSHLNQPTFSFQLSENRRMRSSELNYLEHPVIGVLIKIVPVYLKIQS